MQPIASRLLHAKDASGNEFRIAVGIGQPYEISPDEWACPLTLDGLYERLRDQHGADSWQALQLAYQLIIQLLAHFVEEGGNLFWPERAEPIAINDLFPRLKAKG